LINPKIFSTNTKAWKSNGAWCDSWVVPSACVMKVGPGVVVVVVAVKAISQSPACLVFVYFNP